MEYLDTVLAFAVAMLILSLAVTTLVQTMVALLGLRGRNLLWGVRRVLEQLPEVRKYAGEIADKALSYPAIRGASKVATAVGSEELIAVLRELSRDGSTELPDEARASLARALSEGVTPEFEQATVAIREQFERIFPNEANKLDEAVNLMKQKAGKLSTEMNDWFDTVMNRTTDRFTSHTRWLTVGFAIVLSVGLQIDSFDLIRDLSTDADARRALLQSADLTVSKAEEVLFVDSIAKAALESLAAGFKELEVDQIPDSIVSRNQGASWLSETFAGNPQLGAMQSGYEQAFVELTRERLESLGIQVLGLKGELEESRLVILPESLEAYAKSWKTFEDHIFGVLMTACLLSLGGPFWFNTLRTLSSLRPILAGTTDPSKEKSE